jgi:hypothetical protein
MDDNLFIINENNDIVVLDEFFDFNIVLDFFKNISKSQIDKAISVNETNQENIKKLLKEKNIDFDKYESYIKKEATKIALQIKNSSFNESCFILDEGNIQLAKNSTLAKQINNTIETSFFNIFTTLYDDLQKKDAELTITIFLIVALANDFFVILFTILTGSLDIGKYLTAIFIAPITEETGRRYLLKKGADLGYYTLYINTFEFITYVILMMINGTPILIAISIRLFVALLHHFWSSLQKYGYIKDIKLGKTPEEAGNTEYILAIVLHSIYNLSAPIIFAKILK